MEAGRGKRDVENGNDTGVVSRKQRTQDKVQKADNGVETTESGQQSAWGVSPALVGEARDTCRHRADVDVCTDRRSIVPPPPWSARPMTTPSEIDRVPGLSAPARRALARAKIARLEQLARKSESEIAHLHGIGPNALVKLRAALAAKGLRFSDRR